MAQLLYTVQNLVDEIRAQVDEQNRDSVSTETDILPVLNRGQTYAFDILSRKYPEPILLHAPLTLSSGVYEYDIPEDVFEDRILHVETNIPTGTSGRGNFLELTRISYRDISPYESASQSSFPLYYCIFSRKIRIIPQPTGEFNARIWYVRNPEKLVLPQGRITIVNSASNYVIVDSAGSSLTTESDQLGSYVNVVDGQSGELKGTLQIQSISDNRVQFRTVPTRSTVLNRTVSGSLSDITVNQDDYLSPIDGTCVPYFGQPTTNFLVQFACAEIVRKLGGQADTEEKILDKFEKQVERTWAGRQIDLRVKKKSNAWGVTTRRNWFYWSK